MDTVKLRCIETDPLALEGNCITNGNYYEGEYKSGGYYITNDAGKRVFVYAGRFEKVTDVIKWVRARDIPKNEGKFTPGKVYGVIAEDGKYYTLDRMDSPAVSWKGWDMDRFEDVENGPAKETQVGGNHYSKLAIQPYEYTLANNLGGLEHTIIKYVTRWKDKGGVEDLKKARHTLDFLIEWVETNSTDMEKN